MIKKSGYILSVLLLLSFFHTGCSDMIADMEKDTVIAGGGGATTYAIGDTGPSGVGIVFYVTDGGLHGLEVAPVDQSTGAAWSNITDETIGTTGTAIGTGSANTDAIIGQSGHTASAAQICRDYNGGGLTDWFLPSFDEIGLMYSNLKVNGIGGFADESYWCSSEYNYISSAFCKSFVTIYYAQEPKSNTNRVRAVRAF
jgi:hypothetical protein